MSEEKMVTVTLSPAEADWLMDHLNGYWETGYCGLDEMEWFMPLLRIVETLKAAGVKLPKENR